MDSFSWLFSEEWIASQKRTMRIILRIIAVTICFSIAKSIALVARFWRLGVLRHLLVGSGMAGFLTAVSWMLTIAVGPFAAIQLWRLRASGHTATLLLATYTLTYYIAFGLIWRHTNSINPALWTAIGANAAVVALLLLPSAKRACQPKSALLISSR